jgi:hypothetical protein
MYGYFAFVLREGLRQHSIENKAGGSYKDYQGNRNGNEDFQPAGHKASLSVKVKNIFI